MKTWEMIKELTENPGKKFKRVGDQLEVSVDIDDSLLWKSGHSPFNINHVWEEVKESVDFMTAVNSRKFIKVEHDLVDPCIYACNRYQKLDLLMLDLADNFDESELTEILENGKWYIED